MNALESTSPQSPKQSSKAVRKILLVVEDITITGGIERVVANLANAFVRDLGYEVTICSCFKEYAASPYELDSAVRVEYVYEFARKPMFERAQRSKLYNLYYRNVFERVLSHKICKIARGFDVFIDNYNCYLPPAWLRPADFPISIKVFHHPFQRPRARAKRFRHIVVLSHKQLDLWRRHYSDVRVIPNALTALPPIQRERESRLVLSVGRMAAGDQKGFLRLVDIWEIVQCGGEFASWKLCIVGDGELKRELESKIAQKGLGSSIILKPFTKNIEREYASASIYAMSSHYEALPMVLLEAASMGLAPVAFDINTGPSDVIDSGENGYLVEDGDLEGFASKLCMLMRDEKLRISMGERSLQIVQDRFSQERVLGLWQALFQESIAESKHNKKQW